MKIYLIKPENQPEMLTASYAVVQFCKDFYNERNVKCKTIEYEVKTQGKNYNDIAMPKKTI